MDIACQKCRSAHCALSNVCW